MNARNDNNNFHSNEYKKSKPREKWRTFPFKNDDGGKMKKLMKILYFQLRVEKDCKGALVENVW